MVATPAQWQDVLALAKQLLRDVQHHLPNGEFDLSPTEAFVLGKLWKSVRLYEATLLLLEARLPEESLILGRSLFEESLHLSELAEDSSRREALVLGWLNDSISERMGLIQSAPSFGDEDEPATTLAQLERQRRELLDYAKRRGVGKLQKFLSVTAAARRFGRLSDLWTYEWSHEVVHGSDAAWLVGRRKLETGTVGLLGKTGDPELLIGLTGFPARSLRDAALAVGSMFDWEMPATVTTLANQIQAAVDG